MTKPIQGFDELEPVSSNSNEPANSPENQVFLEGFSKLKAHGVLHDNLTSLVETASQQPSEQLLSTVDDETRKTILSSTELTKLGLFAHSRDEILIKAAISMVVDQTIHALELARRIFPKGSILTYDANLKKQIYDELTAAEDDELMLAIAEDVHENYEVSLTNLIEALEDSEKVARFLDRQDSREDFRDELRDRLINIGSTAVAIALGLTLFEIAKKLSRK